VAGGRLVGRSVSGSRRDHRDALVSHFIAAVGRGQLWWAYGQLEALRGFYVNLIRIEQNAQAQEEAYEKLDQAIATPPLSALLPTFCPMEKLAMLRAVGEIVNLTGNEPPS
jgi:hypothetical protein